MIEVYKDTKIFVACPANFATGGPELLHQLAYHLRKDLGIDAYMYYYDFNDRAFDSPVHPGYKVYGNPYVTKLNEVEDDKRNIIIVPEIQEGISLLQHFKNMRKGVWFLSVDNYYLSRFITRRFGLFVILINKISEFLIKRPLLDANITSKKFLGKLVNKFKSRVLIDNKFKLMNKYDYKKDHTLKLLDFYMFQSHYAFEHFKELNPKYYLSDYLNKDFLKIRTDLSKKENIVVYNPKKGFTFTEKIIKRAKDIQFIPLINMSREEVIKTLQRAKVYIDFGNHPGKDRIPREAAILGCCVITNKRGSAAFYEDVPIPDEYKFEDRDENIPKIVDKIRDCFDNYEERYKDFEYYREVARNGTQRFIENLRKIFVKIEQ
jgi:hypothetical protein